MLWFSKTTLKNSICSKYSSCSPLIFKLIPSSQDHGTLYNDHVQRHVSLREAVRELSEIFPESRGNHETTLVNVFERINSLCGESWSPAVAYLTLPFRQTC